MLAAEEVTFCGSFVLTARSPSALLPVWDAGLCTLVRCVVRVTETLWRPCARIDGFSRRSSSEEALRYAGGRSVLGAQTCGSWLLFSLPVVLGEFPG